MYLITFDIKIIIYFPAKNNFMLVTLRTEGYEGVQHICCHDGFPDCVLLVCEYIIVM